MSEFRIGSHFQLSVLELIGRNSSTNPNGRSRMGIARNRVRNRTHSLSLKFPVHTLTPGWQLSQIPKAGVTIQTFRYLFCFLCLKVFIIRKQLQGNASEECFSNSKQAMKDVDHVDATDSCHPGSAGFYCV